MGKLIDLTGQKINKLTVICLDVEKNNKLKKDRKDGLRNSSPTYWMCECDCGKKTSISQHKLRSGHTTSCGCNYKKYNFKNSEMIGKVFGKWTILEYHHYDKTNKKHYFKCICSCGTRKVVDGYNLIRNLTSDCGCGRNNTLKEIKELDLCGKTFNRLTVIQKIGFTKARKVIYECLCECGQTVNVVGSSLLSNHTTSCGCIISRNNLVISKILENSNILFEREKVFNFNGQKGRFDFYIPDLNVAIEYDGEQHYFPVDFAGKGVEWANSQLQLTRQRDLFKNKYCKENNIKLLRIPYYEKNNIEKIVKDFLISP